MPKRFGTISPRITIKISVKKNVKVSEPAKIGVKENPPILKTGGCADFSASGINAVTTTFATLLQITMVR